MTRIAYLDLVGGVAGDMLLAGLIDAGADAGSVFAGLKAIGIAHRDPSIETVVRGGIRALHLRGTPVTGQAPRTLAEVLAVVHRAGLPADVTRRAEAVFRRLVEAESRAHGEPIGGVHLHEAGDDDAIFDVVGVILALRGLGVDEVASSAVPLGGGRSRSGFPWPGPATLELLRDVPVTGPPPDGEATTPTGAALVATLATRFGSVPAMTLTRTGYGAGTRDSPTGVPNLLRVVLGEAAASPWLTEGDVLVVEANVDDLSPQLLADASEALFAAGALDVWQTPIQMKRGRLGVLLSALATADRLDAVRTAFFVATTTLGVREHAVSRAVLERDVMTVEVRGRAVRIKRGWLDGRIVTAMPEHADLVDLAAATGVPPRVLWQEAQNALGGEGAATRQTEEPLARRPRP